MTLSRLIRDKLLNAFSLGWACRLGRHEILPDEIPESFKIIDVSTTDVKFILVINAALVFKNATTIAAQKRELYLCASPVDR